MSVFTYVFTWIKMNYLGLAVGLWSLVVYTKGLSISGDLRLVNNSGTAGGSFGRLEVYYNGQWGTVCNDNFDLINAQVACRQLGFIAYSRPRTVGALGFRQVLSSTPIWLDNLRCYGNEIRLIDCSANPIGDEDCDHSQDVALTCSGRLLSGALRLVSNLVHTGYSSGRLEVYYSGQWGTVCADKFGPSEVRVACRQLGYSTYTRYGSAEVLGFSPASSSTPMWLDNLHCSGSESRLINCPANPIGVEYCSHSKSQVALICGGYNINPSIIPPINPPESSPQLSGGTIGGIVAGIIGFIVACGALSPWLWSCCTSCYSCCKKCFRRAHRQPPNERPTSNTMVVTQISTPKNTQANAYGNPLKQPAKSEVYLSRQFQSPRVARPLSTIIVGAQTSANARTTAYPSSGLQQTPAPSYSSCMTAPQTQGELGEPKNSELYPDAPPAYPASDYPSALPTSVTMDTSSGCPKQY